MADAPDWETAADAMGEAGEEAAEAAAEAASESASEKAGSAVSDNMAELLNMKLPGFLTRETPDMDVEDIQERFNVPEHVAYFIRAVCGVVKLNPLKAGAGKQTVLSDVLRGSFAYLKVRYLKHKVTQVQQQSDDSTEDDTEDDAQTTLSEQGGGPQV